MLCPHSTLGIPVAYTGSIARKQGVSGAYLRRQSRYGVGFLERGTPPAAIRFKKKRDRGSGFVYLESNRLGRSLGDWLGAWPLKKRVQRRRDARVGFRSRIARCLRQWISGCASPQPAYSFSPGFFYLIWPNASALFSILLSLLFPADNMPFYTPLLLFHRFSAASLWVTVSIHKFRCLKGYAAFNRRNRAPRRAMTGDAGPIFHPLLLPSALDSPPRLDIFDRDRYTDLSSLFRPFSPLL